MTDSIADSMQLQLDRYRGLRQHQSGEEVFREQLYSLQAWQAGRMKRSHHALLQDPTFHHAADFFLTDIYGGVDLIRLTRDIERAMRAALRVLPEKVMHTALLALELNALSQWLDERMAACLFETRGCTTISMPDYLEAFREVTSQEDRDAQCRLVRQLGVGLDKYVRSKVVYGTFRLVKKPAHMAGIDALYAFMDKGFSAMRPMGSASEIVNRIVGEEERLLARVYAGDDNPYGFDAP